MKLEVEIQDDKVDFILELLSNFKFVKAKPINPQKEQVLEGIRQAVEEVNLHKQGKLKLKTARELLDEL